MATRYAEIADFLVYGLRAQAWGTAVDADVEAELDAASALMDDSLNGRYSLPLTDWPKSFRICCCAIAAYLLLVSPRGYNAGAGADENIRKRYDDMVNEQPGQEGWLVRVQRSILHPAGVVELMGDARLVQPLVISSSVINDAGCTAPNRRW